MTRPAQAIVVAALFSASCANREREWPFLPLETLDVDGCDAILRARVDAVRSVSAVLQVAFDSESRSGSFDLVCVYRQPGALCMSAFKSLLLASRPIFELKFSRDRYHVVFEEGDEGGDEVTGVVDRPESGALRSFPDDQPDLAALFWLRELMFLPGKSATPWVPAGDDSRTSIELFGRSADGCELGLVADRATLGVRATSVRPPRGDTVYEIEYLDYRRHGDAFVPTEVSARARDGSFALRAVVVELEVNEPVDESLFRIP